MAYPQDKGQTDKVLNTGRIPYVGDGTNFYPMRGDASGHIILGAGTATAGTVSVSAIKTATDILSAQTVAASTNTKSTAHDIGNSKKATVFINHGRSVITAFGTNGTEYRIDFAESNIATAPWRSVVSLTCSSAACSSIRTGTALAAAVTTIAVVSTTTMVNGDLFMFANTASAASVEWCRVTSVTGTASFTILDGLQNIQASTEVMYNKAEHFVVSLDTEGAQQMRVVVNNNASGTTHAIYTKVAVILEQ